MGERAVYYIGVGMSRARPNQALARATERCHAPNITPLSEKALSATLLASPPNFEQSERSEQRRRRRRRQRR